MRAPLDERAEHVASRVARRALERLKVGVQQAKARCEALGPLEVVEERPDEIATQVDAASSRARANFTNAARAIVSPAPPTNADAPRKPPSKPPNSPRPADDGDATPADDGDGDAGDITTAGATTVADGDTAAVTTNATGDTTDTNTTPVSRAPYFWFLLGVAAWFAAWGMNSVIFSWLVVEVYDAPPRWVGLAQTSLVLPGLLLLLPGGVLADRVDPRRLLRALHIFCALPVAALALGLHRGWLTLPVLIAYGLCLGSIQAFVMPARDAILSRVAGDDMMRAVAGVTICQFGGQALGNLLAGSAERLGALTVLGAQAAVVLFGALGVKRAPAQASAVATSPSSASALSPPPSPSPASPSPSSPSPLADIAEGLATVARTRNLRIPVGLVSAVGVLFIGPFLVTFPILIADYYGGGPARMAMMMMTFPLGTIAGSFAIRARGGIRRKGLGIVLALTSGACVLLLLSRGLSFPLFLTGAVAWGLCGSVFINASRTLTQEAAPAAQRGRVLAVYQLGFVGSATLGATLAGFVTQATSPLIALRVAATVMLLILCAVALFTSATKLE